MHLVAGAGEHPRRVVGAVDGDGQRGGGAGRETGAGIGDCVAEGVGNRLTRRQTLHGIELVVEGVGVGAIRGDGDIAIAAAHRGTGVGEQRACHRAGCHAGHAEGVVPWGARILVAVIGAVGQHIAADGAGVGGGEPLAEGIGVGHAHRQAVDVHQDGAGYARLAAVALVLAGAGGAASGGVAVLVTEGVGERDLVVAEQARSDHEVFVGEALQGFPDTGGGGAGIEDDGQGAGTLGVGADGGAGKDHIAAGGGEGGEVARTTELVVGAGAACAGNRQGTAVPVAGCSGQGLEICVRKNRIRIHDGASTALDVGVGGGGIEPSQCGGIVDAHHAETTGLAGSERCDGGGGVAAIVQRERDRPGRIGARPGGVLAGAAVADLGDQGLDGCVGGIGTGEGDNQISRRAAADGADGVAVVTDGAAADGDAVSAADNTKDISRHIGAEGHGEGAGVEVGGVWVAHRGTAEELKRGRGTLGVSTAYRGRNGGSVIGGGDIDSGCGSCDQRGACTGLAIIFQRNSERGGGYRSVAIGGVYEGRTQSALKQ